MTDNSGWKCVALKTCKNYFIPLFKALRLFIIKKLKQQQEQQQQQQQQQQRRKQKTNNKSVFKFGIIQVFTFNVVIIC